MTLRSFVIGGAGFIGSHLVEALAQRGPVTVYDDLSNGQAKFLQGVLDAQSARLIVGDALDLGGLCSAMAGHDLVVHLAANPEARRSLHNTRLDLEQGTILTHHVLEAMRRTSTQRLLFASSGTVYGETIQMCREQDLGALPISLYGASKLASEALISAFVECFELRAWIFRFGNVVGPRGTHGAALDFLRKLRDDPDELEVLGDGRQSKPYVHVTDCVAGVLFGFDHATAPLNVFNLAPPDVTSVQRIAELCIRHSPFPNAGIRFTGGDRGWKGDVPHSRLDASKLAALGFQLRFTSDEAVERAVRALSLEVFGAACKP